LILGGGRGTRLYPLTKHRSKPAVPLAGKYRLIDIPISNCLNCQLNKMYVLTQFLSVSLHRHIANSYKFDQFSRGFVEILAAQQTMESTTWYQGTADAVRQHARYLQDDWIRDVLVLSGDQLYRMDFRKLVALHREGNADITIAVIPVTAADAKSFGILRLDDDGRVTDFVEKPQSDDLLARFGATPAWLAARGIAAGQRTHLASMGIYLFKREILMDLLNHRPAYADFGKDIFPNSYRKHRVQAFLFDGYWEDLGTVKAYHLANLALCTSNPPFDFHAPDGVIYTRMRFLPAARLLGASIEDCLISDGCLVQSGARIQRSVLGVRSQIGANAMVQDTVLIGADSYETEEQRRMNRAQGLPDIGIGAGSVIQGAIIDKDCRIGKNVRIVNQGGLAEDEGDNYVIRDGIVCIPKDAVVADGTVI
jgi:glucose-1-phosphate adenylyltransferase